MVLVLLNVVFWAGPVSDSGSPSLLASMPPPPFEPDPPVPEDDVLMPEVVMREVEDVVSGDVNAFYLGTRFPADGCRFGDSESQLKLLFSLHFALIMYMQGKARGSGKEMHLLRDQFLCVWELLQNKYGPFMNSGQVQRLEDVV